MLDRTPESLYYTSTELFDQDFDRALCIAPHPDDEILGAGGYLSMLARAGARVDVLVLTLGDAQGQAATSRSRAQESRAAAQRLGLAEPEFANFHDRDLRYCEPLIGVLTDRMERMPPSVSGRPSLLFAPSLSEPHPDHQAVALAAMAAVQRVSSNWCLMLYEVGAPLTPNCWVDISSVETNKWAALAEFQSQEQEQPYLDHAKAMAKLRSFGRGRVVTAAEAFFRVNADDLRAKGAAAALPSWTQQRTERQAANATSQLPLVSVIVRSIDRPELLHAMASVAAQTYPNIELVVVNASGRIHSPVVPPTPNLLLRLVNPGASPSLGDTELRLDLCNQSPPPSATDISPTAIGQPFAVRAVASTQKSDTDSDLGGEPSDQSLNAPAEADPTREPTGAGLPRPANLKASLHSPSQSTPGRRRVETYQPLGRSAAANLGLAAAQGELAMFLDDDDLILPAHLEGLVSHLLARPKAVAAYAGVRVETSGGELIRTYSVPWSHWRLQGINFLPIHGVLFRLGMVRSAGICFDESLPVLEDWCFWRDLSRCGEFSHVDAVTAVYRQDLGDSQLADAQHPHHWKVWHRKILARSVQVLDQDALTDWLAEQAVSWDLAYARSESLKTSLDLATIARDEAAIRASSLERGLDALQRELIAEQDRGRAAMLQFNQSVAEMKSRYDHSFEELLATQNRLRMEELAAKAAEIDNLNAQWQSRLEEQAEQTARLTDRLEKELSDLRTQHRVRAEHLQQKLVQALAHESTLQRELNGVYRSRSWRMTQPIRSFRRFWQ